MYSTRTSLKFPFSCCDSDNIGASICYFTICACNKIIKFKFSENCDPIRLACMTSHCTHHLQNTLSAKATAPIKSETCVRDVSTPEHEMQYRRPTYEVEMFDNLTQIPYPPGFLKNVHPYLFPQSPILSTSPSLPASFILL